MVARWSASASSRSGRATTARPCCARRSSPRISATTRSGFPRRGPTSSSSCSPRSRSRTKRLKLATGIANVFSRSAGLLAMSAATLDEISEGRAILGLGTSGKLVVENFHGVPYAKPLTRLRETVGICARSGAASACARAEHALRRAPLQARDEAAARRTSRSTSPRCRRRRSARSAASPTAGCRRSGRTGTSSDGIALARRGRARGRPRSGRHRGRAVRGGRAARRRRRGARHDQAAGLLLHRRHGRLLPRALLPLRLRGERRPGARALQRRRAQARPRPR